MNCVNTIHPGRREHRGVQRAAAGDDRGRVCGGVCGEAVVYGVPELRLWGFVRGESERGLRAPAWMRTTVSFDYRIDRRQEIILHLISHACL